jgi:2-polyprenyl-6-methoxyphenol hydroxylase-like FAD-dependent oxidoreductase
MDYDLAIVGGGLAGSSLGMALAKTGARVLIVEREAQFRDRVRGEGVLPWGVAEAQELGIYQPLLDGCAHETRWWTEPGSKPGSGRDHTIAARLPQFLSSGDAAAAARSRRCGGGGIAEAGRSHRRHPW